ncbi:ABC transporter permease [Endozoicomonas sp. G2_1]|uniref:ABC transporter permease n=1 Tax=Endozoicomonas sp. G2_1 TaxID=2821091 RepID=UPI001ADAE14B|nr:ABC transporter permease [Endozoicomonas sp. G2_1]MBO9490068.1 ABC transporter permease [Endozoicomonas sp. G2_1]
MKRFWAVFQARNLEFFRDRASLGWNLLFPVLLLAGFSFIFSGDGRPAYKIGILNQGQALTQVQSPIEQAFRATKHIEFVDYGSEEKALRKLDQHGIDLLISYPTKQYWLNTESPQGYLAEKIFLGSHQNFTRLETNSAGVRYVDWVLPGILAMNMMFSSLFGVGYVIVRYRKNSVLKRLKATPLSAFEFVSAQLASRLFIVMFMSSVVYTGCNFFFDFYMQGSYLDLFIVGAMGAICLISLGLLVASKSKSEELTGGLLNMTSWPMMLLSGVWFSLEGAPQALKTFADFLPLTHLVTGARKVITEGASLADISYHLGILALMSAVFLGLGAWLFDWHTERK